MKHLGFLDFNKGDNLLSELSQGNELKAKGTNNDLIYIKTVWSSYHRGQIIAFNVNAFLSRFSFLFANGNHFLDCRNYVPHMLIQLTSQFSPKQKIIITSQFYVYYKPNWDRNKE